MTDAIAAMEKRRRDLEAGVPTELARTAGWQLHLAVPADRWSPTTQAVMKHLTDCDLSYHMRFGVGGTQVLTVSAGGYDHAVRVAKDLDGRFGNRLPDHPRGSVTSDDVRLSGPVWAAFSMQGDKDFTKWTVKGVPLDRAESAALRDLKGEERVAVRDQLRDRADARLVEKYGAYYAGAERVQALEKVQELQRSRDRGHGY